MKSLVSELRVVLRLLGDLAERPPERIEDTGKVLRAAELEEAANAVFWDKSFTPYDERFRERFAEFLRKRRQLAGDGAELADERIALELRRPRSLLLSHWKNSLFDGFSEIECGGFVDFDDIPAWNVWLGTEEVSGAVCLVTWVPRWAGELLDHAIAVNCMSCLGWAHRDGEQLRPRGWGKTWEEGTDRQPPNPD